MSFYFLTRDPSCTKQPDHFFKCHLDKDWREVRKGRAEEDSRDEDKSFLNQQALHCLLTSTGACTGRGRGGYTGWEQEPQRQGAFQIQDLWLGCHSPSLLSLSWTGHKWLSSKADLQPGHTSPVPTYSPTPGRFPRRKPVGPKYLEEGGSKTALSCQSLSMSTKKMPVSERTGESEGKVCPCALYYPCNCYLWNVLKIKSSK